jgi:hypothetical protein
MAIRCLFEFGHYKQNEAEIYLLEVGGGLGAKKAKVAKKDVGNFLAKTQRRKVDGGRPVIPSEVEGFSKDFSLRSK